MLVQTLIMVKYLFCKYFCKYPRVLVDTREYKKNRRVPHNGYLTNMGTGTGGIFIQRVGYRRTIIRTLPAPLTS